MKVKSGRKPRQEGSQDNMKVKPGRKSRQEESQVRKNAKTGRWLKQERRQDRKKLKTGRISRHEESQDRGKVKSGRRQRRKKDHIPNSHSCFPEYTLKIRIPKFSLAPVSAPNWNWPSQPHPSADMIDHGQARPSTGHYLESRMSRSVSCLTASSVLLSGDV